MNRHNFLFNLCGIRLCIFQLRTGISNIAIQRRDLLPEGFTRRIVRFALFERSLFFATVLRGFFEIGSSNRELTIAFAELRFHAFKISAHRIEFGIRRFDFLSAQGAFEPFAIRLESCLFTFGNF